MGLISVAAASRLASARRASSRILRAFASSDDGRLLARIVAVYALGVSLLVGTAAAIGLAVRAFVTMSGLGG